MMFMLHRRSHLVLSMMILLVALMLASAVLTGCADPAETTQAVAATPADTASSDAELKKLFDAQKSDVTISGNGTVLRLLSDDNEGDRHQRFIIELSSGQTLLVAHNIDIAPRVEPLDVGDTVEFAGEYVWNDQGGIIHWTHHDPGGSHTDGFIKANGQTFQ